MSAVEALNKLAKWRSLFAGWQLGTRPDNDPEVQAVRDHRELSMMLRVEVNALTKVLMESGVLTPERFDEILQDEAEHLDAEYEQRFPGVTSTDHGLAYDLSKGGGFPWMAHWKP